jgi:hypothetical protein
MGMKSPLVTEVTGRDIRSGSPRSVEVLSNDVVEAVDDSLRIIASAFVELIQETPRAMAAGINQRAWCYAAVRLGCGGSTSTSRRRPEFRQRWPRSRRPRLCAERAWRSKTSKS